MISPIQELRPAARSNAPRGVAPADLEELPPIELDMDLEEVPRVLLYVLVHAEEQAITVRILEGGGPPAEAVEAVREAASNTRFSPATRDGVPGQQWTTLRGALSYNGRLQLVPSRRAAKSTDDIGVSSPSMPEVETA